MTRRLNNWLDAYIEFTADQESPLLFHKWTAMAVISSVLQRNVKIDRAYYTIYPNLFVILIAGSAKCRKSVSTIIGISLLRAVEKPPMIFAQKITNEALIHALSEAKEGNSSFGLIYSSELSVFMGADAIKGGLIPTLTDLYDSPESWSYRTRGRGVENLDNATISILAASTKDWLRSSIPESAIGGGFTSRIIFVYQDTPRKASLFPTKPEGNMKADLIADLNDIAKLKGEFIFSEEAKEKALKWYENEIFISRDAKTDGYYGRKHDTMFKVAAILCVSESNSLIIQGKHIDKALEMLGEIEGSLHNILESVAATDKGTAIEKILNIIKRQGEPIQHSRLLSKTWRIGTADEINTYIRTLVDGGEVIEDVKNNVRYYKAKS